MATKKKRTTRTGADPGQAYSMPYMSPMYIAPPMEYRDNWSQHVTFRSDPKVISKWIPRPLVPDPDGLMFMLTSYFVATGFGHYREATLCAHARFKGKPVNYTLFLMLNNDMAICGGREIWGWPKKLGTIEVDEKDGIVQARVGRGGVELVRANVVLNELVDAGALGGTTEYVNWKFIPSVKNGAPPDVNQLTLTELTNFVPHRVYRGPATIEFGSSPADRYAEIPVLEVIEGFYYGSDFILEDGEVIHDYLK
jgi:acetoacetate decarboxylase